MGNKVVMEVTANLDEEDSDVELTNRGSFAVYYSKNSEINRMIDTKNKEKFKVTIERM